MYCKTEQSIIFALIELDVNVWTSAAPLIITYSQFSQMVMYVNKCKDVFELQTTEEYIFR